MDRGWWDVNFWGALVVGFEGVRVVPMGAVGWRLWLFGHGSFVAGSLG